MEIQYPPRDESLNRILEAMDAAEQAEIPVVVVQHKLPEDAPIFAGGCLYRFCQAASEKFFAVTVAVGSW
ncbi:hypothetical protein GCM10027092_29040 [Yaniella soli]